MLSQGNFNLYFSRESRYLIVQKLLVSSFLWTCIFCSTVVLVYWSFSYWFICIFYLFHNEHVLLLEWNKNPLLPSIHPATYSHPTPDTWKPLIVFLFYNFVISRMLEEWYYTVCELWGLTYRDQYNSLEIQPSHRIHL